MVLVPTRELAKQVARDFEVLSDSLSVLTVYGGTPYWQQGVYCLRSLPILIDAINVFFWALALIKPCVLFVNTSLFSIYICSDYAYSISSRTLTMKKSSWFLHHVSHLENTIYMLYSDLYISTSYLFPPMHSTCVAPFLKLETNRKLPFYQGFPIYRDKLILQKLLTECLQIRLYSIS